MRPLLLAVLVMGGFALRLATDDRYLTFVDYTDEGVSVAPMQERR